MGFFRDFYQYFIRESWLILTKRLPQAMEEADARAEADVDAEREKARGRPKYRGYVAEIAKWKESFEELVSKMEEEGAHRKIVYTDRDFLALPAVPELHYPFGAPYDHDVAYRLFVKTQEWRRDRIEQLRSRLGSQR